MMAGKTLRGVTGYVNLSRNDCDFARGFLLSEGVRVCRDGLMFSVREDVWRVGWRRVAAGGVSSAT
jgi:hypothetical protein